MLLGLFRCACLVLICFLPMAASAQSFSALARAVPEGSAIEDGWFGKTELTLNLSGGVPWRVFTVGEPDRVVMDFREVDFRTLDLAAFDRSEKVANVLAGNLQAGWSRMILVLTQPVEIAAADLHVGEGQAALTLALRRTGRKDFDAAAGVPEADGWAKIAQPSLRAGAKQVLPDVFTVAIDPGHGGIDPGATRNGLREADLVLQLAKDLEEALVRAGGMEVVLTRTSDDFVSLERRVAIAQQAGAHVFVSLHADALKSGQAEGASVFTLPTSASDEATNALVERHDRNDLLAQGDLTGTDDQVAQILLDLARQDSLQRSQMMAEAVVAGIRANGSKLHKQPLQEAGFSVLKSADIPSILIEAGFLSTDADLERLRDPVWRAQMARGIRDGLLAWSLADRAVAPLRRK